MNDDDNDDDFIALRKYFTRFVYTKRIVVSCFKQIASEIFTTVVNVSSVLLGTILLTRNYKTIDLDFNVFMYDIRLVRETNMSFHNFALECLIV